MNTVEVRSWTEGLTPHDGTAVVFDIFRCSTTIHCLASRRPSEFLLAPRLHDLRADELARFQKHRIYSELPAQPECQERFDNSPWRALQHPEGSPTLVATTSGTPGMFAARDFGNVIVGSLVSFGALLDVLRQEKKAITLIPATLPHHQHVEDNIVAEAVKEVLEGRSTETAIASALERIHASGRPAVLHSKLPRGIDDVAICLDVNRFSFVPKLSFIPHLELAHVNW